MKMPKKILVAQDYSDDPYYKEYKYRREAYKDCYEYVHWWKNPEGKWKPFFKYIQKGSVLWYKLEEYLKTGKEQTGVKFIYD